MKPKIGFKAPATVLNISAVLLGSFSLEAAAGATLTADTFVSSKSPAKNNGGQVSLSISNVAGDKQTTLLKFDLGETVPAGSSSDDIAKATLKVFVTKLKFPSGVTSGKITADTAASTDWQEALVNGGSNIAASLNYPVEKTINSNQVNQWLEFDVSDAVRALNFASSPNNIAFTLNANDGIGISIDSKESKTTSQAATLDIAYAPRPKFKRTDFSFVSIPAAGSPITQLAALTFTPPISG